MDDAEAKQLLSAERERVQRALAALDEEPRQEREDPVADHEDGGEELFQAGRDEGQRERLEETMHALNRADERLSEGRFGRSVDSGDQIPDERLRAQPTAERTVAEQQRYEARG